MSKTVLDLIDRPVFLVTAALGKKQNGCIATWVVPASFASKKKRLIVSFSKLNLTTAMVLKSKKFALHLLSENQWRLVPLFGLYSGREFNKLSNIMIKRHRTGLPLIQGTCGWMVCKVYSKQDLGDRVVVVADVTDFKTEARRPLLKAQAYTKLPRNIERALVAKQNRDSKTHARMAKK